MHKHYAITYCYHFLAEAIIAFLILIPFTFDYYEVSHYFGYILIIFLAGLLFYLFELSNRSNAIFLLVIPVVALLFYLFQFPLGLTLFFPLLFVWRYMSIRLYKGKRTEEQALKDKISTNKARLYLHMTMGLAVLGIIYSKEVFIGSYVLLQFFILFTGYLLSNVVIMSKQDREKIRIQSFLFVPLVMLVGSVIAFFFFDPFRVVMHNAWIILRTAIVYLATSVVYVIEAIIPNFLRTDDTDNTIGGSGNAPPAEDPMALFPDEHQPGIDESVLVFVLSIVALAVIGYLIYRVSKRKREHIQVREHSATFHSLEEQSEEKESLFNRIFRRTPKREIHPVRALVYDFEKEAIKHDWGRYPFESIDEWFRRLKVDIKTDTYEKVRYGDLEVNEQEIDELKEQLNEVDFKKMELHEEI